MDRNLNIVMLSPVLNIHQVGIADELFKQMASIVLYRPM